MWLLTVSEGSVPFREEAPGYPDFGQKHMAPVSPGQALRTVLIGGTASSLQALGSLFPLWAAVLSLAKRAGQRNASKALSGPKLC